MYTMFVVDVDVFLIICWSQGKFGWVQLNCLGKIEIEIDLYMQLSIERKKTPGI